VGTAGWSYRDWEGLFYPQTAVVCRVRGRARGVGIPCL